MTDNNANNKRIAKNTMLLYFRMLFTMAISLYTSRVILNTLGVEDFGIYNVVGGVVAMFSVISGSLSSSVSRFLTFELGKNNFEKLKGIFSTAVTIHIFLALIIFVLAEGAGIWFLNAKMNIASSRIVAANWILQCSILTFMVNLISVPYNASIIAHEKMKAFAYVSILEVSLKLLVVYLLVVLNFDKLIVYGILLFAVAFIVTSAYRIYCKKNFEECRYNFYLDKNLFKEISGFAGWNFIGVSSAVLRDQGVNIIINLFCGAAVNAARGIAFQVNTAIQGFVTNFMTALNPQITKSYASGDHKYMMMLVQQGARLSFYMLLFLSLPIIIETKSILAVWLKIVPDHAVNFVRLILIFAMSEAISGTLITAMLATGKIRNYQIVVGGLQLMNFPISYILLKMGFVPESTMIVAVIISQCCLMARLWMLRSMIKLSVKYYLKHVYMNVIVVSLLSVILPYWVFSRLDAGIIRFFCIGIVSMISTIIVMLFIGCNKNERQLVLSKVNVAKQKILKQ